MNFFVIILLWHHILYLCTLFLVQGGKNTKLKLLKTDAAVWFNKSPLASLHEKQHTQIHDMLPQQ